MATLDPGGFPLATSQDVVNRWRPLAASEAAAADALLEEAEAILALASPGIRARAAASPDAALAARSVIVSMVLRVLRNPDSIRQFTIDDFTQIRDQAASSGLLYVTPEELAYVQPAAAVGLAGLYVVGLGG